MIHLREKKSILSLGTETQEHGKKILAGMNNQKLVNHHYELSAINMKLKIHMKHLIIFVNIKLIQALGI